MGAKVLVFVAVVGLALAAGYLYWAASQKGGPGVPGGPNATPAGTAADRGTGDSRTGAGIQAEAAREVDGLLKEYLPKSGPERGKLVEKLAREPERPAVKPGLLALLDQEKDEKIRAAIVRAVGVKYRGDPQAVPALARCMAQGEGDAVREAAGEALRDLEDAGRSAVPGLVELLARDEHRLAAFEVLGGIGPAAAEAVTPVAAYLGSKRVQERRAALKTLARVGTFSGAVLGDAQTGIVAGLKDEDPGVRAEAAHCLKRIGREAQRADIKGLLEPLLKDPNEGVRRAAQGAWEKLFAEARE
jgi:HEAT repeat protein